MITTICEDKKITKNLFKWEGFKSGIIWDLFKKGEKK